MSAAAVPTVAPTPIEQAMADALEAAARARRKIEKEADQRHRFAAFGGRDRERLSAIEEHGWKVTEAWPETAARAGWAKARRGEHRVAAPTPRELLERVHGIKEVFCCRSQLAITASPMSASHLARRSRGRLRMADAPPRPATSSSSTD
jgi:hypothetical protein